MRKLHKQDIVEILYGATLLGAGGGGSLCFGLDMGAVKIYAQNCLQAPAE